MESIVDVRSLHIDRLLFFYSEQNVDDVDTIKFWEGQIINYCLKNRTVVFTVEALTQVFIVDDVYPSSLEPVIHNLKTKHKRITECVEVSNEMDTLMSLFSTVSLWALDGKAKASVKYMSIDLLEMIEIQLMSYVSSIGEQNSCVFVAQGNKVPSELTFMGLVRAAGTTSPKKNQLSDYFSSINEDDATLILRNMVQSKRAVLSGDGTMVKIQPARRATPQTSLLGGVLAMWSTATSTDISAKGFSEAEEAYLRLRSSIRQIEARIEALREGAAAELNKAKLCKAGGDDQGALFHLRLRRSRESARDKLLQSLVGLVEAQEAIGQSDLNILMTNAYRVAAQSLKASREGAQLTAESAAEAMETFQEEMDEMAQISDILTTGSAASLGTVEEQQALEAELCELLEQENVAATNVPSTVEVPVSVSANETELPVAPVSRTIHHLVDSNKVKIGFSAPAPHLA